MHGSMNIKFINAKQAIEVHAYKNIKLKLYKTNATIWFNKTLTKRAGIKNHHSGRRPKTYLKPKAAVTVFELLMMGGVSPETC
jgi:hypothetical protein